MCQVAVHARPALPGSQASREPSVLVMCPEMTLPSGRITLQGKQRAARHKATSYMAARPSKVRCRNGLGRLVPSAQARCTTNIWLTRAQARLIRKSAT